MTRARAPAVLALVVPLLIAAPLGGCATKPSHVSALLLPPPTSRDAFGVAIACDPARHDLLMSWLGQDSTGWRVWFARSADRGVSWSVPVAASPAAEPLLLDPESSPRMACDDENRVGIAWCTRVALAGGGGESSDLRFANSLDGGRTWSPPVTVNDDTLGSPGRQSLHDLALRPGGALFAAWLDSRPGADSIAPDLSEGADASIWFARSEDFGTHWGPNAAHWSRASTNCRVSLVVDPGDNLFVSFRKHYTGQIRDVALARPGGPPVRMHEDDWRSRDGPAAAPAMTLSRDGTLRLAWYTGAPGRTGVWFRESVPELMDSTTAPIPVLVANALPAAHIGVGEAGMSGTLIACDVDPTGASQLTLVRVESAGERVVERFVVPGTLGASYPTIATERAGRSAFLAWTAKLADHRELRLARWDIGR